MSHHPLAWVLLGSLLTVFGCTSGTPDHKPSVARIWNEILLNSIRGDFARPTVHARNLFHVSAAMYDAWAAYDHEARPFFLGNTVGGFSCNFDGVPHPIDVELAREEAISFAAYRILRDRFALSPGATTKMSTYDATMEAARLRYREYQREFQHWRSRGPGQLHRSVHSRLWQNRTAQTKPTTLPTSPTTPSTTPLPRKPLEIPTSLIPIDGSH